MKNIILLGTILLCSIASAQNAERVVSEQGYWTISSAGETVGAAGYSLTKSDTIYNFTGWTILNAAASGTKALLRFKFTSSLDSLMRLRQYTLHINDSIEISCEWKNGNIDIDSKILSKKLKPPKSNGEIKNAAGKSAEKIAAPKIEKPNGEIQKSVEKPTNTSLSSDTPPYILDMNVFPELVPLIRRTDLKSGNVQAFDILIPQMQKLATVQVAVGHTEKIFGRTALKTDISGGGIMETAWVDSLDGRILKIECKNENLVLDYSKECPDTTELESAALEIKLVKPETKIKCENCQKFIENPLRIKKMSGSLIIEMSGTPSTKRPWQKFDGSFRNDTLSGKFSVSIDEYNGKKSAKFDDFNKIPEELKQYIEPSKDIPSDDAWVRKIAKNFDGKTIWEYTYKANRWIADNIKQNDSDDPITAAKIHLGNPLARARLLTAVLRSKGIPAKVVGGVYYFGQIWVQHYWTEVWLGKKVGWRPVDPSTGEDKNFSAVHITLFQDIGDIKSGEIIIKKVK